MTQRLAKKKKKIKQEIYPLFPFDLLSLDLLLTLIPSS